MGLALLVLLAGCRSAGPFQLSAASGPTVSGPFQAGVATAVFTPSLDYPLGGYGGGARRAEWPLLMGAGWPGQLALAAHQAWHEDDPAGRADLLHPAEGVLDELTARALVLRPQEGPPLAIVRIDAIASSAELHAGTAAAVADLGYRPEQLLLAASHTHSGVGCFARAAFGRLAAMDNFRPEIEARIIEACALAVRAAHARARPARIGFAEARDRGPEGQPLVARNRRARHFPDAIPRDAIDDSIRLLAVEDARSGRTLALVVNYAVHPTVLGSHNMHFSADLSGAIERALARRLPGAEVLFLNGAQGDIGPGRLSPAEGPERCTELAEAFAGLTLPALEGLETHADLRVSGAFGEQELGSPRLLLTLGRERFLDGEASLGAWPMELVTLPLNLATWGLGFWNIRTVLTWTGALGLVIHLTPYTDRTRFRLGALRLEAGGEDVVLLGIPGEPTHDLGLVWRAEAARRGATRAWAVGLAYDHVGYIASRTEFRRGGYEAWATLFGEGTGDVFTAALSRALSAVGYSPAD